MPRGVYEHTKEQYEKSSKSLKGRFTGESHHNWKGGITPIRKKMYYSDEYKIWRKSIFERDNYTCVWCGKRGVELNADHIKPWCDYPELRFDINNGRTLCLDCHRKTFTWGKWDYSKSLVKRVGKINNGSFKKGHKGYKSFLGKKLSMEHRKKISEANKRYWINKKST